MDDQLGDVPGYDPGFLRVRLDLPAPGVPTVLLDYVHFSVRQLPARRLAAIVGVNINGPELRPLVREGRWHLDVRIPQDQQAGADLYRNNSLDRGHLVRRLDPVWGAEETARTANQDTFTYTNAAPQVADFNQGKDLWLGLEDHVLDHADAFDARISVFTGPVFRDDDPLYRGVRIPRKFWKIAAWTNDGKLGAAGFVLDQSPMLEPAELEVTARARLLAGEPPPLGPYRTFQVGIELIANATGLELRTLTEADRLRPGGGPEGGTGKGGRGSGGGSQPGPGRAPQHIPLERPGQIRL